MTRRASADPLPPEPPGAPELPDPTTWVDEFGDYLFRYVVFRVRDRQAAEDLVQETFLAALGARQQFVGRSSPRTWLVGILKRKVVDHLRRQGRRRETGDREDEDLVGRLFDARGKWRHAPATWGNPEAALEREEFWEALYRCLSRLPERLAAAFTLRELEEQEPEQVRAALRVSAGNLNVLLHRARLRLSRCLDLGWFGGRSRED